MRIGFSGLTVDDSIPQKAELEAIKTDQVPAAKIAILEKNNIDLFVLKSADTEADILILKATVKDKHNASSVRTTIPGNTSAAKVMRGILGLGENARGHVNEALQAADRAEAQVFKARQEIETLMSAFQNILDDLKKLFP